MRVLIATDGSDHAQAALTAACRILNPGRREVDVACVAPEPREELPQAYERNTRRARRALDGARQQLAREGVSARTLLRHGSPARVLVKHAEEYDVAVLGSAGRRERSEAGLGPVVSRVVEHSRATVLVGRSCPAEGAIRVLLPVDGSQRGFDALDRMIELVNLEQAEITLVHVVETPWFEGSDTGDPVELAGPAGSEPENEFLHEGERLLESARDRLPSRTAVNTLIYEGLPADEILGEANRGGYDLVVLGSGQSHGDSHDLKQQMLGSVSSKVAWNADCSVLLIR